MFTVTVTTTSAGHAVVVNLPRTTGEAETTAEDKGPSPIAPEVKELAWGAGAFFLLLILMRLVLFPRLKAGMDARYGKIRGDHQSADDTRAAARAEVAEYEAELATVKAEARQHIEEAVADVSSRAAELATGRRPDAAAVSGIVSSLMAGGGQ